MKFRKELEIPLEPQESKIKSPDKILQKFCIFENL